MVLYHCLRLNFMLAVIPVLLYRVRRPTLPEVFNETPGRAPGHMLGLVLPRPATLTPGREQVFRSSHRPITLYWPARRPVMEEKDLRGKLSP